MRNKSVFFLCGSSALVANIAVGTMPLLIPIEVLRKSYHLWWIGVLFLVYGLVVFVFEFFQSKIVPVIGGRRMFVVTTGILGISDICFGFLSFTNNQDVFGSLGCIIRILEALCYAGLMNSVMTIFCLTWPDEATLTVGIANGIIGFGYALGPLLSGALFDAADFTLPYALYGITLIGISIWGYYGLPAEVDSVAIPDFTVLKILYTDLDFIASGIVVFGTGIFVGFLEATLELYLAKFGLGATLDGTIFFTVWTISAVSSPLWGWIMQRSDKFVTFLLIGPFIEAIVYAIFGPLPGLESLSMLLGLSIFCLIIMTIVTSMSLVVAFDIMLRQAERHGIGNGIVVYAFISAIWLATLYLGEGIGGIVSGTIIDAYKDYGYVAVALVALELITGILAAGIIYISWRRRKSSGFYDVMQADACVSVKSLDRIQSSYERIP